MLRTFTAAVVAVAALAVACGPAVPFAPSHECHADGWGPIYTEDARPCACIVRHAALARSMLTAAGITEDMRGATVWIHRSEDPFLVDGGPARGSYEAGDIVLTRWAYAWVHEALHHIDTLRGEPFRVTAAHTDWGARYWSDATGRWSWWDLTGLYWGQVNPLDGGEECP